MPRCWSWERPGPVGRAGQPPPDQGPGDAGLPAPGALPGRGRRPRRAAEGTERRTAARGLGAQGRATIGPALQRVWLGFTVLSEAVASGAWRRSAPTAREHVWRPSRPYMLAGDRHDAARAPRRGIQRYQWPREESVAQGAESACGDGSGTITTGHAVRRAQARATDPGARRPPCGVSIPSTSRSPPRTSLIDSAAARPQTTCCLAARRRASAERPGRWRSGSVHDRMPSRRRTEPGRPGGVLVDVGHGHGRWTNSGVTRSGLIPRRRDSPTAHASAHQLARERLMPTTRRGTSSARSSTALLSPRAITQRHSFTKR